MASWQNLVALFATISRYFSITICYLAVTKPVLRVKTFWIYPDIHEYGYKNALGQSNAVVPITNAGFVPASCLILIVYEIKYWLWAPDDSVPHHGAMR